MPAYNPSIPIYPKGHLFGLTLSNNGSDATNDIDFAAGQCVDSTGVAFMVGSALTKQLDATWAAGTNAGGKMSAAAITNTTYYCFAIRKDSDGSVDYGFDTSPTAPTMPSGYTYFRRIGAIIRASNAILAFTQIGDRFRLTTPTGAGNSTIGDSRSLITSAAPPNMEALLRCYATRAAGTVNVLVQPVVETDASPDVAATGLTFRAEVAAQGPAAEVAIDLDSSSQFAVRASAASTTFYHVTKGWIDTRGRLA